MASRKDESRRSSARSLLERWLSPTGFPQRLSFLLSTLMNLGFSEREHPGSMLASRPVHGGSFLNRRGQGATSCLPGSLLPLHGAPHSRLVDISNTAPPKLSSFHLLVQL